MPLQLASRQSSIAAFHCFVSRLLLRQATFYLVVIFGLSPNLPSARGDDDGIAFFESKVRPILVERCYECHSAEHGEANSELTVDTRSGMTKGGTRGSLINLEAPEQSLLLTAVEYRDSDLQMPPDGKMPDAEVAILREWLSRGAPDPRNSEPATKPASNSMDARFEQARSHWAYQPLQTTSRESIDSLIARKLRDRGIALASEADRATLTRRLHYDLLGLPADYETIMEWSQVASPDWYEQLVDRLLASPHFGERMARRWMDVARYADNKGYVFRENKEYEHAYRYRDWLVKAFNSDMSFSDFVRFQLAADKVDPQNVNGNLDAMGFLTLGRRFLNNKFDIIDDRIDVVTRGFLGTTAVCARCHDHKFDAVTAADYYSLFSVFDNSQEPGDEPGPMRMIDKEKRNNATFVFLRGNPGNRGPKIEPAFFKFLSDEKSLLFNQGSGREALVTGIIETSRPLACRVYVNRVWGWVMGRPIVDTPSDFGLRSSPPVQVDVLEHLASSFAASGSSTKKLIREIVLSKVYQQSSLKRDEALEIDPENQLYWRYPRKRMDFESFRDAVLHASRTLNYAIGGKSEIIHQAPFSSRRTLYGYVDRHDLPSLFQSFDFASPDQHAATRPETTIPQQSLVLMNSDMMFDILDRFALPDRSPSDLPENELKNVVFRLVQQILNRDPSASELSRLVDFLMSAREAPVDCAQNHWTYGFGRVDLEQGFVRSFEMYPTFDGKSWRGRQPLPDSLSGWSSLTETGGHPGKPNEFAAIRRWTATQAGTIQIRGTLEHAQKDGDGVRAAVIRNRNKLGGIWSTKNGKAKTPLTIVDVSPGDTIDFVVDCIDNESHDAFVWKITIEERATKAKYDSAQHFSGRQPGSATPWKQLAQALMMTNEFCFID